MPSKKSLLLLCGDSLLDLDAFSDVVVISPIRRFGLAPHSARLHTLSDFAPGKTAGELADKVLYRDLDHCLHDEARVNPSLRWAPISYLQLQLRLSRYCWLKRTLEKLLRELAPTSIVISSNKDSDLVHAAQAVTCGISVRLEFRDGEHDQGTSFLHRVRPYGLPQRVDPPWITKLRWGAWRACFGKRNVLLQPYWNLQLSGEMAFLLKSFSVINLCGRVVTKLLEVLHAQDRHSLLDRPVELQNGLPELCRSAMWQEHFSTDELFVINNLLNAFVNDFPNQLLDKIEHALLNLFDAVGVRRVIMLNDRLDACRMISHAAHQRGIAVDYLPHGLVFEDFSGECRKSSFMPDRVLAWSEPSALAFRQLGWSSTGVIHPQFEKKPYRYRELRKNWPKTRVLVLSPEWQAVTQSASEDCAITDMMEIYAGLTSLGFKAENIHVKLHSATSQAEKAKRAGLAKLRDRANMNFMLLETTSNTAALISNYDLLILGLTTGIYEAVMLGVPVVVFGMLPARVGGLRPFVIPAAASSTELVNVLERFDNCAMGLTYKDVAASLRLGPAILTAVGAA